MMALAPDNPFASTNTIAAPINMYSVTGLAVGASATVTLTPQNPSPIAGFATIEQGGYELTFTTMINAGAAIPFVLIKMQFYDVDQVGATPIEKVWWYLPCGANPSSVSVWGKGPQRGAFMSVQVINQATGFPVTFGAQINDVSRQYSRDDWRTGTLTNIPTYTNAGGQPESLVYADINNVGSPATRILPLYAGKIRVLVNTAGLVVKLQPQNAGSIAVCNITGVASAEVNLGRDIYVMSVTGTGSLNMSAIMEEY